MTVFGVEERRIAHLVRIGENFILNNIEYIVIISGKPTCRYGEPKTDIYILAENIHGSRIEIKISFKMERADFLENKINAERAEQILGPNWQEIIIESIENIRYKFLEKRLIFKVNYRKTERGSITLGWKFELTNKGAGELSGILLLDPDQVIDVYSGTNLDEYKRNAKVMGNKIENSGVANCILMNDSVRSAQDVIDNLVAITDYAENHSQIYFACKALNYRTIEDKWDGNRPLAVYIDWGVFNNRLTPCICFENPLNIKGDEVVSNLKSCLRQIHVDSIDDLSETNTSPLGIIVQ